MRRTKVQRSFRPLVESSEARVLSTVGLNAAGHAAAAEASAQAAEVQSWITLVNRTYHSVTFDLSGNGGHSYHTFALRARATGTYHVDHSAPDFFIKAGNGPAASLPSGPTKAQAPAYALRVSLSVNPVLPKPDSGGGSGGGGGGGGGGFVSITGPLKFVNMTSRSNGPGNASVVIQLSINGGTFRSFTIGAGAQSVPIGSGSLRVVYRLPANPSVPETTLTMSGPYTIFSDTSFRPYLFPTA